MAIQKPIPFSQVISTLLDESIPLSRRYVKRLSDIDPDEKAILEDAWHKISLKRRVALLKDMDKAHMDDTLLCFDQAARIALKDPEPSARTKAIQILREYELKDLLPTFVSMAETDPDADVRAASAAALSTFIYLGEIEELSPKKLLQVEECLLRLTSSSDAKLVRRRALEALGFSSRKEIPGLIEAAYASPDTEWLITALFAMGRSANTRWNAQVFKMLDHPDPRVRAEAASAAGELEIKASVPTLIELLGDDDLDVRVASMWSLSQIGGAGVREALEYLRETVEDDDEANLIDTALENLDFTEEIQELAILDIPEDGIEPDESSDDDIDDDLNEFIAEDDEN